MGKQVLRTPAGIKGRVLMPKYLVDFLESIYDKQKPSNFGERMVTRDFIKRIRKIYNFLDLKKPLIYSRQMVPEYLIARYNNVDFYEVTKEDMANKVTVPEGSQKYVLLNKLGGMSYKSKNLIVLSDLSETTTNGITYKVENGIIYVKGTTTTSANVEISLLANINLSGAFNLFSSLSSASLFYRTTASDYYSSATQQEKTNLILDRFNLIFGGTGGTDPFSQENWITIKPMLVSGSTAPTEFKQGFEGIRDSVVTSVVSKDSNDTTIDTYTIPAEIQALDGYGWGVNDTCYNYIDYDSKKLIQNASKYIVNNETEVTKSHNDTGNGIGARIIVDSNVKVLTNNVITNLSNLGYNKIGYGDYVNGFIGYAVHNSVATNTIYVRLGAGYDTVDKVKTFLVNNGIEFVYELAESVETDISEYLEDETYIEVAPGGSITFENEYDNDVPSEITYLLEV